MVNHDSLKGLPPDSLLCRAELRPRGKAQQSEASARDSAHVSSSLGQMERAQNSTQTQCCVVGSAGWAAGEQGAGPGSRVSLPALPVSDPAAPWPPRTPSSTFRTGQPCFPVDASCPLSCFPGGHGINNALLTFLVCTRCSLASEMRVTMPAHDQSS